MTNTCYVQIPDNLLSSRGLVVFRVSPALSLSLPGDFFFVVMQAYKFEICLNVSERKMCSLFLVLFEVSCLAFSGRMLFG